MKQQQTKEKPLVSVLMTVYNREKYIAEAVESVIASSYQNWELIIVDDRSSDKSVEIANAYAEQDNRITVCRNDKNLGQFQNRNKAASYAKGKYLKYLDSDDIIYSHGLEVMVAAMEQYPKVGIGLAFNSYDNQEQLPTLFSIEHTFKEHFFNRGILYIGPSGCIYNRDFFEQIGGFDPEFKVAADYEFNMRAAVVQPVVLFQRDLIWWRQHDGQEITVSSQNNEYVIFNYLINKKTVKQSNLSIEIKDAIIFNNYVLMARRMLKMIKSRKFKAYKHILKVTGFSTIKLKLAFSRTKKLDSLLK